MFGCVSQYGYAVSLQDGGSAWLDVEERARVNLQRVDMRVESGEVEKYESYEEETMRRLCALMLEKLA